MRRRRLLCAVLPVFLLDRTMPLGCAFVRAAAVGTFLSSKFAVAADGADTDHDSNVNVEGESRECKVEASPDAKGEATSSCGDDEEHGDNVSSPWSFMKAFSKFGTSWNHVIGEYISVINSADGKDVRGDVYVLGGVNEALPVLRGLVQEAGAASEEGAALWSFRTTPLEDFRKEIDDILIAFLRWSAVDSNPRDDDGEGACQLTGGTNGLGLFDGRINVSKAFRRLTSYVQWMESVGSDLVQPPLTFESIEDTLGEFSIHVTHDSCGRLVWWVDLGRSNLRSREPRETIRMFVWVAHLLFFDEGAQEKGLVVADDMAKISFLNYMTMLPVQVGLSIDRFLISVTPFKTKNVLMMNLPQWAEMGYSLLSWFLTAKMKSRVTMVKKDSNKESLLELVGSESFIPVEFGDVGGTLTIDMMAIRKRTS